MSWDYFRLAYKSALTRKIRSWLTMIGIFIGIAAVVSLISLSQGLQNAIADQFIVIGSDKIVIQASGGGFGPPGTAVPKPLNDADLKLVQKTQGVGSAVGRIIRPIKAKFKDETRYTYAASVPNDAAGIQLVKEVNRYEIGKGRFFNPRSNNEIVLGAGIAEDLFTRPLSLRSKVLIQDHEMKVVGILESSGNPQRDRAIVIPENKFREILKLGDEHDLIGTKIAEGYSVKAVGEKLAKELRKLHNVKKGKEDFEIQTPEQIISTLNNIILVIQGVLVGIAAISLIVGGIGIMNTMYTAVLLVLLYLNVLVLRNGKLGESGLLFFVVPIYGFYIFIGSIILGTIIFFIRKKLKR